MHKFLTPVALLTAFAMSPGHAAPPDGGLRWTRVVKYADLDLSRAAGAETLYSRLVDAARRVCEPDRFGAPPSIGKPHCAEDALAAAVATLNAPTLTDLFHQKQGAIRVTLAADDRTISARP
jgi:UrcA family protein